MKRNHVAIFAMAVLIPAAACGQKQSETDTSEPAHTEAAAKTENTADFHTFSTGGLSLDCALGFEQLKATAIATQDIEMVAETDEQIAYMTPEGMSFTMTKEPHYAHPMILRRDVIVGEGEKVAGGNEIRIDMAACGYGTKEASDRMMEAFALLNEQFMLQQKIRVAD